tara:strand:- start:18228 stop:18770 length:543 start_codon:yes stop_codon:yes gene_type:complete
MFAAPLLASLGASAAAAGGLGTALSVASAVVGGVSAVSTANYNAMVADRNAVLSEQNASAAMQQAGLDAKQQDLSAAQDIGQMIAAAGASGLGAGLGSYALRRRSAESLAASDRQNIIAGGQNQAQELLQQSADFKTAAAQERSAAKMAVVSTALGVGTSLVSGADRVARRKVMSLQGAA